MLKANFGTALLDLLTQHCSNPSCAGFQGTRSGEHLGNNPGAGEVSLIVPCQKPSVLGGIQHCWTMAMLQTRGQRLSPLLGQHSSSLSTEIIGNPSPGATLCWNIAGQSCSRGILFTPSHSLWAQSGKKCDCAGSRHPVQGMKVPF